MSQIFTLPDVGEGLTEADVVSWRVAVGDTVAVNDIICEIETAKSLVELPVPFAGTVAELVAAEGETIEVGQPLIRISAAASDAAADEEDHPSEAAERPPQPKEQTTQPREQERPDAAEEQNRALVGSGPKADAAKHRPRLRSTVPDLVDTSDMEPLEPAPQRTGSHSADIADLVAKASPPVRALAKRLGVAAWELVGSGRNGQITRGDVESRARQKKALRESGETPGGAAEAPSSAPETGLLYEGPREETVQVRGVRKATAINVAASASDIPHVSVFKEVDVTRTMELRRTLKNQSSYQGLSVSPLLFAAKAIIWAARRSPQVNATWHGTHYTLRNYVNLGIAAATPRGLVVPVIHDAHAYSTRGLASAITQLTTDARQGRTTPAEMKGGTVSITNVGTLGLDFGTPILPPDQAAIVALGAVRRKPWIVDGQIVARDVMVVGGSFDHRLIDGDLAGAFISDVAAVLEEPGLLLD